MPRAAITSPARRARARRRRAQRLPLPRQPPLTEHGWTAWSYTWDAGEPGDYELWVRATDAAGNTQPLDPADAWNQGGYGVNAVQRVALRVT